MFYTTISLIIGIVVAITIATTLQNRSPRLKVLYCIYHLVLCILAKIKISFPQRFALGIDADKVHKR